MYDVQTAASAAGLPPPSVATLTPSEAFQATQAFAPAPSAKPAGLFGDDWKNVLLAVAAYVLISVLPVEDVVERYVAVSNIPYSSVLIKAAVFGVAVWIGFRVLDGF
jgi:hypothetical protein